MFNGYSLFRFESSLLVCFCFSWLWELFRKTANQEPLAHVWQVDMKGNPVWLHPEKKNTSQTREIQTDSSPAETHLFTRFSRSWVSSFINKIQFMLSFHIDDADKQFVPSRPLVPTASVVIKNTSAFSKWHIQAAKWWERSLTYLTDLKVLRI